MELKDMVEELKRDYAELQRTVKDKAEAAAKGIVDPLIEAKIARINEAIDEKEQKRDQAFSELETKVNRMTISGGQVTGEEAKRAADMVRKFNLSLRSLAAQSGRGAVDLDAESVKKYNDAYELYLRRGDNGLSDLERRALSVGVGPSGGYLVSPDASGRIVEKVFETSPMRQYSSVQQISTDSLEGSVDLDEAACGWTSELGTRSESTTPTVPTPWIIPVHEGYAEPRISQKLVEDANIDVVAWLAKKVANKISRTQNAAFVTGAGTGKPRGFASYTTAATADASRSWGQFEHVGTGVNGSFGTDPVGVNKLLSLIHAMKDPYAVNAGFFMNRTTLGKVRQLTDGSGTAAGTGRFLFVPSFLAGQPDTLLGYPVRKLQDMADYSTTGALAIAFGDMAETYQIVDRLGITVLVDPYTAKPYVKYYTRFRTGGDVVNFESMKFLKMA
jgi:HK97 family phage major capsid protein